MNGPFQAFLQRVKQDIDSRLHLLISELPEDRIRSAMEYGLLNGGKRIRPALCYAAAEIFGPVNELTHKAGAALELIHAYSLIHDDLPAMDNDELRRGKPTCHIAFDEATAILAGDALQTLAFDILSLPHRGCAERQLKLVNILACASGARGMVLGQSMDIVAVNKSLDFQSLEQMHRCKTGALINAAIQMGAVASDKASDSDMEKLAEFGQAVGLAFQIKDDILDMEGSTEALGKTQGADLALNKPTYTTLMGISGAKEKLHDLHMSARNSVAHFGTRGDILRSIADFVVLRAH